MKITLLIGTLILMVSLTGYSQSPELTFEHSSLESWADSIIEAAMADLHIPGLAFAIVNKDSLLLSKGYGMAKLHPSIPIDPLRTHFDMGSIPKALTAVGLMRLVDQGKVDLNQDIRESFPFIRHNKDLDESISLHQLLTHSAGLDDLSNLASASRTPDQVPPLQDFIKSQSIYKLMKGGEMSTYSNIGYAIIGAIIEQKSGKSFPAYMKEYVLDPLAMHHSTFFAELEDSMEVRRAMGYEYIHDTFQAAPVNYQFNSPAAGLRSTGGDMANFVQMLLNKGRFKGRKILAETSVKKMLSRQFSNHADLPALGYSLREESYEGWKVWGQNGAWQGFNHDFFLIPEADLGLVICLNTDEGSQLAQALIEDFVQRYLPKKPTEEAPFSQISSDLKEYSGIYRGTRFSRKSITKLGVLLGFVSELEVELRQDSLFYYGTALLYEGRDVFRRADGLGKIAFLRNEEGQIEGLARSYSHYEAHQKISFYQSSSFHLLLLGLLILALLLIAFFSAIQYFKSRRKQKLGALSLKANRLSLLASIIPILWLIAIVWEFSSVGQWDYQYGATATLNLLLAIPFCLLVLQVYMIYYFFKRKSSFSSRKSKGLFFMATMTLLAFLLFLYKWNFIGYNY